MRKSKISIPTPVGEFKYTILGLYEIAGEESTMILLILGTDASDIYLISHHPKRSYSREKLPVSVIIIMN